MKKVLLASAMALSVAGTASAADFTGFYLGAQLGYGSAKTKLSSNDTNAAGAVRQVGPDSMSGDIGARGVVGGLHVGYGKQFDNRMYLGLEAWGNLSNTNGNIDDVVRTIAPGRVASTYKATRRNEFGIALKPGIVFNNALLYVKLGVASASWKKETTFTDVNTNAAVPSASSSNRHTAFVPGIGVSFMATDHVMVGVEATHSFYNSKSIGFTSAVGVHDRKRSTSFKPEVTDFVAKIAYKW